MACDAVCPVQSTASNQTWPQSHMLRCRMLPKPILAAANMTFTVY